MADTNDWGDAAVATQPQANDWGDAPVEAPKLPDTSGVQKMAQDNLAANDNKPSSDDGEVKAPPTPEQRLDTAIGMPVGSLLNPKDETPLPAPFRRNLTKTYADGTATDAGDFAQTALPAIANLSTTVPQANISSQSEQTSNFLTRAFSMMLSHGANQQLKNPDFVGAEIPNADEEKEAGTALKGVGAHFLSYEANLVKSEYTPGKPSDFALEHIVAKNISAALRPIPNAFLSLGALMSKLAAEQVGVKASPGTEEIESNITGKLFKSIGLDSLSGESTAEEIKNKPVVDKFIVNTLGVDPNFEPKSNFAKSTKTFAELAPYALTDKAKLFSGLLSIAAASSGSVQASDAIKKAGGSETAQQLGGLLTMLVGGAAAHTALNGSVVGHQALKPVVANVTGLPAEAITGDHIDQTIAQGVTPKAPTAQDFKSVEMVTDGALNEKTLHIVFNETGVKPDQVFEDSQQNPQIASDIKEGKIPQAYEHLMDHSGEPTTPEEPHVPYYDFDSDSYGVKQGDKPPVTGFDRMEDAQTHADEKNGGHTNEQIPTSAYEDEQNVSSDADPEKLSLTPAQERYANKNKEQRSVSRAAEEAKLQDLENQVKPYEDGTYKDLSEDEIVHKDELRNRANKIAKTIKDYDTVDRSRAEDDGQSVAAKGKSELEEKENGQENNISGVSEQPIYPERIRLGSDRHEQLDETSKGTKVYSTGESAVAARQSGEISQNSEKAGTCYKTAGEISKKYKYDTVIGTLDNGHGKRIYHAVNQFEHDGKPYIYDGTYDAIFTPEAYDRLAKGWAPVKELSPAEVRDHGQSHSVWPEPSSLGLPPAKTIAKPQGTIPPSETGKPTSLSTFIKNNGGIKNDEFVAGDLANHKDLLKPNGKNIDEMGDMAHQHGYFAERPSVEELRDSLNDTNGGREHYREADIDRRLAMQEKNELGTKNDPDYVEHVAHSLGIDTEGKTTEELKDLINDHLGEDSIMHRLWNDEEGSVSPDIAKDIRNLIAPTMAGEGAVKTAAAFRKAYGEAARRRAVDETELEKFAKQSAELTTDPAKLSEFYNYVEGRSKGAKLSDPSLQAMADGIRSVYEGVRAKLESMPENRQMRFVQDYFSHQWKDEAAADKFASDFIAQQGSTRNLKKRIIPTIEEGLAAGLELKEPNPVRGVSKYIANMNNYIASVDALRSIVNDLGGTYASKGMQPEGFEPLVGKNAERIENAKVDEKSGKVIPARTLQLYAPSDVATIYNRFYSKGFEDTKGKSVYELAKSAVNANTLMELGLSTYHAGTITIQSLGQDLSRMSKNALIGDWKGVVDAVKGLAPGVHYLEGGKGIEQYKMLADHGVDMEAMAQHFADANIHLGLDPLSRMAHQGFAQVIRRGEFPELVDKLKEQAKSGYGLGLLKSGAEVVGRAVSDVSAPLFNHYIPRIKFSAFSDLMGDWLRQNPEASKEEIQLQTNRIGNLVDDRFGELNMENIFWYRMAKQVTGLIFRAPGWDLGLIRQVGGAPLDMYRMLRDAATGKKFNPDNLDRPLNLMAGGMVMAAMNSLMTYLKTGTPPSQQDIKDFLNYRTGGTYHTLGADYPERAVLPGHAKEVANLKPIPSKGPLSGLSEEAVNKVASLPKNLYQAWMNQDRKGKPLYKPGAEGISGVPGLAQAAYVAKGFEPFSITNFDNTQEGSKLSFMERALGVKPAGARVVAPEQLGKLLEKKKD